MYYFIRSELYYLKYCFFYVLKYMYWKVDFDTRYIFGHHFFFALKSDDCFKK